MIRQDVKMAIISMLVSNSRGHVQETTHNAIIDHVEPSKRGLNLILSVVIGLWMSVICLLSVCCANEYMKRR